MPKHDQLIEATPRHAYFTICTPFARNFTDVEISNRAKRNGVQNNIEQNRSINLLKEQIYHQNVDKLIYRVQYDVCYKWEKCEIYLEMRWYCVLDVTRVVATDWRWRRSLQKILREQTHFLVFHPFYTFCKECEKKALWVDDSFNPSNFQKSEIRSGFVRFRGLKISNNCWTWF